jgi:hypothetical protein
MAETFDVAGRLAEGEPAVADLQALAWATHLVGYQNPALTADPGQLRDWYASEDGMDLRALDADSAALSRAAAATRDALARQDDQQTALSAAWTGGGAAASQAFLRRHAEACGVADAAVRLAAERLTALRDEVWRLVDAKVAATASAGAGMGAQRAAWLAAAQTVSTGAGDRPHASELVDQQVKPFVVNVIGGDWLTAMRSAQESVDDAYDAATAALSGHAAAVFEVPSGVGPVWVPSDDGVPTTVPAAASAPTSAAPTYAAAAPPMWSAPAPAQAAPMAAPPMAPAGDPAPAPAADAAPADPAPAMPAMPAAPSLGSMPDLGGGLSGFGQQLADMLGGLIGSPDDASELDDPANLDDPSDVADEDEDPDDAADEAPADDEADDDADDDPSDPEEPDPPEEADAAGVEDVDTCATDPNAEPAAPTPVPEPPAAPIVSAPPPQTDPARTPCEIAADELPQVGQ